MSMHRTICLGLLLGMLGTGIGSKHARADDDEKGKKAKTTGVDEDGGKKEKKAKKQKKDYGDKAADKAAK
ncbi:MAG TPA: hypothetical protein VGP07_19660 [Polyangia bacterium]|jgi:hypothetical protein